MSTASRLCSYCLRGISSVTVDILRAGSVPLFIASIAPRNCNGIDVNHTTNNPLNNPFTSFSATTPMSLPNEVTYATCKPSKLNSVCVFINEVPCCSVTSGAGSTTIDVKSTM